jgi:hypothetical protein
MVITTRHSRLRGPLSPFADCLSRNFLSELKSAGPKWARYAFTRIFKI